MDEFLERQRATDLTKRIFAALDDATVAGWEMFKLVAEQQGVRVDERARADIQLWMRQAFAGAMGDLNRLTLDS